MIDDALDGPEFDAYVAELDARGADAAERSPVTAARPDADRRDVTFAELRVGDYMTNEPPGGRWVRVAELRGPACYVRSRRRSVCGDGQILRAV